MSIRTQLISQHDDHNIKGFFEEYRWLSNFHEAPVVYEKLLYKNSEAAYQAAKTIDTQIRIKFTQLSGNSAKQLGRTIPLRDDWDLIKVRVMEDILTSKFTESASLRAALLDTKGKYLEETNWWNDKFWGVCNGEGENMLGKLLMKIRDEKL